MDDLPSFCSMLCIFTRHGRREKEEADDEGRHAEERSGIADVSDSRIRADDAAEQGAGTDAEIDDGREDCRCDRSSRRLDAADDFGLK